MSFIEFEKPVIDPAAPKGMYRTTFIEPYVIEVDDGLATITAKDGRSTVTSHRFHGTPLVPVSVSQMEPFELTDDTRVATPKAIAARKRGQ